MTEDQIIIYQSSNGETAIDVKLQDETVWLTQTQMQLLFDQTKQNISLHINNIFKENELTKDAVVKESLTTAKDGKRYKVRHYSLDVIISIGYRIKSKKGTQFRIWANNVLKEYLIKGYAINQKRLKEQEQHLKELKSTVSLLSNVLINKELNSDEATGLLRVVTDYAYALDILDRYDHQQLKIEGTTATELFIIDYKEAKQAITDLKEKFGGSSLFGNEKDQSFKGSIAAIYQTFGSIDLYPSVEEKAANLLYFVVKNHSFSDGNKRIAAYLFVWFLDKNDILYKSDGSKRIADNALVALTLMIAESKSDEKEMMVKVIVNLINVNN
ncbi:cytochrome C biogenesis protein CycH [Pedobacter ginsengisoli]|uniref:Cytochrome C biogenesis protein CycH n=1 Tax=Pedobacter ginsengisoli TaxID=363852 RepID=A0A2D1U619_9SPHI|nr:RhuM family protein [Pedobacter ginsengisoli]ATP57060.1 cytochrome C biogenesis protein CycH [Pedobacter ginsengisoli]